MGSKNDGGISIPFAPPIRRGVVRCGSTARNSAIGLLRLQIVTRSPFETASRNSDSFALASAILTTFMTIIMTIQLSTGNP